MNLIQEKILNLSKEIKSEIVFIAVSGGVDSMLLLDLSSKYFNIHALHVNYQLRGQESDEDQLFIEEFCSKRGIPLNVLKYDLKNELKAKKTNLQNRAREIRYDFFSGFLHKNEDSFLFLAHHSDDQIETFFLQFYRDSGIAGLSCMREINKKFVRPLLGFSKQEIIACAIENKINWREDSSNSKNTYLRNFFRNELIPSLHHEIPTLKSSILELIACFQVTQKFLEDEIREIKYHLIRNSRLEIKLAESLTDEKIIELFRQLSIPKSMLSEWKKLLISRKGALIELPELSDYLLIIRENDYLEFISSETQSVKEPKIITQIVNSVPDSFDKNTLYLDLEKISGELNLRHWIIGDRIYPIGLNGSKLISDVFTDSKVPNHLRTKKWLLCDREKIISCIGYSIDRRAIVSENSKIILKVEIRF
jgi:tRNA(Ile)-lysidine synthase